MASGNEWLNGYLEAILDAGASAVVQGGVLAPSAPLDDNDDRGGGGDQSKSLVPGLRFSPTRYFVEEVVNSFDEADLYKTWVKVIAMRNSRDRNNRLENMCWRIWNLARKKKQIEMESARGLAKRRMEREQGRRDASEDISELSEGEMREKGTAGGGGDSVKGGSVVEGGSGMHRNSSEAQIWPLAEEEEEPPQRNLYIVLISLHGLVRGENMELGRDSDTGGQVKYVVELARALAAAKGVRRVDLLTRQISSPEVDWTYGEPVEMLQALRSSDAGTGVELGAGGSGAAYIIRLPFGPREKYIPKESLWPYIPEFVDRALAHILDVSRALCDQHSTPNGDATAPQPALPYVIHGHYADAAEAAARLAGALGVPMAMTGHSLGRNKLEQLLKQGRLSRADIHATYKIMRRIEAEELGLDAAEVAVTSTRQEVDEQWGLYDGFDVRLERKLRVRRRRGVGCLGRYMPRMAVIPPGMDFSNVKSEDVEGDLATLLVGRDRRKPLPPIWSEIMRFFSNPHKPMILALSRPDPKKNVTTLIRAFGESRHLRELANMTLILGNRDDVEEMAVGSATVLTTVLKLIDKYDLYGHVAYPKHHKQSDVPEIYRLAAKTKGVFVNPALVEPFGLTLIEAAAYGLPVVATKNGGPVDIIKALNNGLLIDPHDHRAIADALLKLLADKSMWQDCRKNGLKNIHKFSWPEHCRSYLAQVDHSRSRHPSTASLRLPGPAQAQAVPALPSTQEPLTDSLRGVDISLRMSLDGPGSEAAKMHPNGTDVATALLDALRHRHASSVANGHRPADSAQPSGYGPGRRRKMLVVAADCYGPVGVLDQKCFVGVISAVSSVAEKGGGSTGLVLSTGMTLGETSEALKACGFSPAMFDALVCSGGADLCFPWRDGGVEPDPDYTARVGYRWPGVYVKAAVPRLSRQDGEEEDGMAVDEAASSSQSYAYSLKTGTKALKIDEIRQRLRMRGFRCNLVYSRAGTRLIVMPLFASRAYALRYLWMIWRIDLSKTVVFVGDQGDTDLEELHTGLNKVVVLRGAVRHGSEALLRGEDNYKREDVVPPSRPGDVTEVEEQWGEAEIASAVEGLGLKC